MKKQKTGLPILLFSILCLLVVLFNALFTAYRIYRDKYTGEYATYFAKELESLDHNSLEYRIAKSFGEFEKEPDITFDSSEVALVNQSEEELADTNGDGVEIQHVYGDTYEGYMMVVKNPKMVSIAINPDMGSGKEAPELEDYVERNKALGGINGGGFEDAGGVGNGSIPAGITIMDGKLISGGNPQPILGITKDHKLVADTLSPQQALDMGIVQAVTFGPTFITNGRVSYRPGTDNLNMVNPRTAIGQKEDGTFLLLVIDGRGPSSFGAKYEDVVKIFQDYEAVNAGNLDGGNSSVMIYNGRYIHYPVSMYDSRSLPSVFLVKEAE